MESIDLPATITALGALVTAVGVILIAYWSYRGKEKAAAAADLAHQAVVEVTVVKGEVREVGARIDGRLTELLASSAALARAEGVAQGEQSQRDRQSIPEGG